MMYQRLKSKEQKTKRLGVVVGILCCFLVFTLCSFVSVQAVSISPLKHTVVVDPGVVQDVAFLVKNDTQVPQTYIMTTDGFLVDSHSGRAEFGHATPAQSWLSFPSGNTFTLKPQQDREVVASIRVPKDETPDTYYIGVFAQETKQIEGTVRLGARVGTLVFLTVAGVVQEDMRIDYIAPTSFIVRQSPAIELQLSNNGTIVSLYRGVVHFTHSSGRDIGTVRLNDRVYAGMKKVISSSVPTLSWRDVGPIRVTASIQYGVEKKIITQTTWFWYLPLWSYGMLFVVSLGVVLFVLRMRKIRPL